MYCVWKGCEVVENNLDVVALPNVKQRRRNLSSKRKGVKRLFADQCDLRVFDVHLELMRCTSATGFTATGGPRRLRCQRSKGRQRPCGKASENSISSSNFLHDRP